MIQLKAHLNSCPGCAESYTLYLTALKVIDEERQVTSNPFLATRIMAAIEDLEKDAKNVEYLPAWKRILQPALLSVSILVAVGVGILAGGALSPSTENNYLPVELTYLNDADLELTDFLSLE
jgi:hypothetical protein